MKKKIIIRVLTGLSFLSAMASGSAIAAVIPGLHQVNFGDVMLTFDVTGNGCTTSADFSFVITNGKGGPVLTIERPSLDTCGGPNERLSIAVPFTSIGVKSGTKYMIGNQIRGYF